MGVLNSASLVITPNGYKASKLYSVVPTDGSGDMTFTRAGDTATRVNSSGLIETVLANKPRLDYTNSTCPKLLMEPQRTNIFLRSSEFDNAQWVKFNATITTNSVTSPDGTQNAETFTSTSTLSNLQYFLSPLTNGQSYTTSVYVKAGSKSFVSLGLFGLGDAYFNLTTLTYTFTGTGAVSASIIDAGNGWRRISATWTWGTGTTYRAFIALASSLSSSAVTSGDFIYLYGAQFENAPSASSYIPTTTATVTRNQDSSVKTAASSLIGQIEGTIFFEIDYKLLGQDGYRIVLHDTATSYSNLIYFRINTSSSFSYSILTGAVTQAGGSITLSVGRHKIALAYKANDVAFFVDGVLVLSDTTNTIPPLNEIQIANTLYGSSTLLLNYFALWKTRLSNDEILALTTL